MKLLFCLVLIVTVATIFSPKASADNAQRILFVAPHPDDEMLGTGAEIWKAQHTPGVDYRVVLMTCGDAYQYALTRWIELKEARDLNHDGKINYLDLGIARHLESLAALASLGVPKEKVIFLGYPDGGLDKLPSKGKRAYTSKFTKTDKVPYSFAYHWAASYNSESVIGDLEQIISNFDPSVVYSTTPTDTHPDHAFTRAYVTEALQRLGGQRTHLEYLVHWEDHMEGWPEATAEWQQPAGHIAPDIKIELADLGMSRKLKESAIKLYQTQTNVEHDYLINFAKDSEIFWNTRPNISDYLSK